MINAHESWERLHHLNYEAFTRKKNDFQLETENMRKTTQEGRAYPENIKVFTDSTL